MSGVTRRLGIAAAQTIALSWAKFAREKRVTPQLNFAFAAKILVAPRIEQSASDGKRQ
jgi:hypothetical protein